MYFFKIICVMVLFLLVFSKGEDYKFGKKADKKEYKMVAHVTRRWGRGLGACGGTVVTMNKVMTSMLCLYYVSDHYSKKTPVQRSGKVYVTAGSIYTHQYNYIDGVRVEDKALQERSVTDFLTPSKQEIDKELGLFQVDLLILVLNEPLEPSDSIRTAYLYVYEPTQLQESIDYLQSKKGPLCHLLSWGYNHTHIYHYPRLWTIRVKFISNEDCKKRLCDHTLLGNATRRYCPLNFHAMGIYCAKYEKDDVHTCFGNLGDPVVCMTTNLFGVLTFRVRTDEEDCKPYGNLSYPLLFTRVEHIKRFTQEQNVLLRSSYPMIVPSSSLVFPLILFIFNID